MEPKETVFVVDDDPDVRQSLTRLLEEVDLPVQAYESAQAFLDAYDPTCPGCLLLDVRMPGIDGIVLHKTLKERGITLPVIIITGHGDVRMAVEAIQRGAMDFIEKPFRSQPLLERISAALARGADIHKSEAERKSATSRMALLSERQRQVMMMMVAGETTKTTAMILGLSIKTVDYHRAQIMEKTQAGSVPDLVRMVQAVENDQPSAHRVRGCATCR